MSAPQPVTPGQAAYEAFTAVRYAGSLTTGWTSPIVAHKAWDAGAQAAIGVHESATAAELAALRELLEEVGVLAANAPEDGDSWDLLQEIAMRIAAHGIPLEGEQ